MRSLFTKLKISYDAFDELFKYVETPPRVSIFASAVRDTLEEGQIYQKYQGLVVKKGQVKVVKDRKDRGNDVRASDSHHVLDLGRV